MRKSEFIVRRLLDEAPADQPVQYARNAAQHFAAQPPAIHRTAQANVNNEVLSERFLAYIRRLENPNKAGWNAKLQRWFPHKDPSGGLNIGYGHHFSSPKEAERYSKQGMTDAEVEQLLVRDLQAAQKIVHDYIQRRYKVRLALTPKQEQMLIDYAFNLGNLNTFPKMVDAVLRNQKDKMGAEYKRYANIGGKRKELKARNDAFSSAFLREQFSGNSRSQLA